MTDTKPSDVDGLIERLRFPWEKMGAIAAPKISRILKERREAATTLAAQQARIEALERALRDTADNCPQCDGAAEYKHKNRMVPCEFCETARAALKEPS